MEKKFEYQPQDFQAAEEEEKVPNVPGSSQNPVGTQAKIQGQSKESETKVPGKYEILNEIAKGQKEIVAGLKTLGSNIQKGFDKLGTGQEQMMGMIQNLPQNNAQPQITVNPRTGGAGRSQGQIQQQAPQTAQMNQQNQIQPARNINAYAANRYPKFVQQKK
eukprot:403338766